MICERSWVRVVVGQCAFFYNGIVILEHFVLDPLSPLVALLLVATWCFHSRYFKTNAWGIMHWWNSAAQYTDGILQISTVKSSPKSFFLHIIPLLSSNNKSSLNCLLQYLFYPYSPGSNTFSFILGSSVIGVYKKCYPGTWHGFRAISLLAEDPMCFLISFNVLISTSS